MKLLLKRIFSVLMIVALTSMAGRVALPVAAYAAPADNKNQTVTRHEPEHQVIEQTKKSGEKSTWYWWVLAGLVIAGGAAAAAGGGGGSSGNGGNAAKDASVSVGW